MEIFSKRVQFQSPLAHVLREENEGRRGRERVEVRCPSSCRALWLASDTGGTQRAGRHKARGGLGTPLSEPASSALRRVEEQHRERVPSQRRHRSQQNPAKGCGGCARSTAQRDSCGSERWTRAEQTFQRAELHDKSFNHGRKQRDRNSTKCTNTLWHIWLQESLVREIFFPDIFLKERDL